LGYRERYLEAGGGYFNESAGRSPAFEDEVRTQLKVNYSECRIFERKGDRLYDGQKKTLVDWIEEDRERLIEFLSRFVQARAQTAGRYARGLRPLSVTF